MKQRLSEALRKKLVQAALAARQQAHAPYSGYAVGAAVLSGAGVIYSGCNIENASFPLTICAERVAVFKAVSEGDREVRAVAVVTRDGGSPCGACRQVIAEFGAEAVILIAGESGVVTLETTIRDLLPHAFTSASLKKD